MTLIRGARFSRPSYDRWFDDTKHDIVSFTRAVGESLGEERRWIHHGLTSNDVKDTALSLQMVEALEIIRNGVKRLMDATAARAIEHKDTPCMGRSPRHSRRTAQLWAQTGPLVVRTRSAPRTP